VRLIAADLMLSRAYGKPEVRAEIDTTHRFAYAQVPEVMSKGDWLASRGQPEVLAQLKAACPDASTPDDIIDLKAESDDTKH
jgi:hypothetical protein